MSESTPTDHPLRAKDCLYTSKEARENLPFENNEKSYSDLLDSTCKDKRTLYQHDRDAILYTRSFRRLMHKTQVTYPGTDKDEHTRTRLTHTLEVAQIARGLAYNLGLNQDLAEAISYGHDLGHTPFGHEGEDFLDMVCQGCENTITHSQTIKERYEIHDIPFDFKHNYQSVRVLLKWEDGHWNSRTRKIEHGVNISKQTLEGILKHSSVRRKYGEKKDSLYRYDDVCKELWDCLRPDIEYAIWSVEGQIVALADEIAQVCHDLEDAIFADYTVKQYLYREINTYINNDDKIYNALHGQKFIITRKHDGNLKDRININKDDFHSFISWTIGYLILYTTEEVSKNMDKYVERVLEEKRHNGEDISEENIYDIDYFPLTEELVPAEILENNEYYSFLKKIENKYIINNVRINRENGKADFILEKLIEAYLNKPKQLPDSVLERYSEDESICTDIREELAKCDPNIGKPNVRYIFGKKNDEHTLHILSCLRNDPVFLRYLWDYLASMTDQYALNQYKMLYLGDSPYNPSI